MNFLNKLERKFGKYAIPHLTSFALIWLVGTIIGGIFMLLGPVLLPILVIWMIYWLIKGPRR